MLKLAFGLIVTNVEDEISQFLLLQHDVLPIVPFIRVVTRLKLPFEAFIDLCIDFLTKFAIKGTFNDKKPVITKRLYLFQRWKFRQV